MQTVVGRRMGRLGNDSNSYRRTILDMDSTENSVYGEQERAAYNGNFVCVCYHPLFCFNQSGDYAGVMLRPEHLHSAHG